MSSSSQFSNEVKSRQRRIMQEINKVKSQLLSIEEGKLSQNQPFISFRTVANIKELRSPHRNFKEALQFDLHVLQNLLKQLKTESRGKREGLLRKEFAHNRVKFDRHLQSASKDGVWDEQEIEKGLALAQAALKSSISLLMINPSYRNMKTTLNSLENAFHFGADINWGVGAEAMSALKEASRKRHTEADKHFRNIPNTKNLELLLKECELTQVFGAEVPDEPADWKPAGNKTHSVVSGDTLSGLAEQYYGKKGYWDVIYLDNFSLIGDKPDLLRIGTVLVIP